MAVKQWTEAELARWGNLARAAMKPPMPPLPEAEAAKWAKATRDSMGLETPIILNPMSTAPTWKPPVTPTPPATPPAAPAAPIDSQSHLRGSTKVDPLAFHAENMAGKGGAPDFDMRPSSSGIPGEGMYYDPTWGGGSWRTVPGGYPGGNASGIPTEETAPRPRARGQYGGPGSIGVGRTLGAGGTGPPDTMPPIVPYTGPGRWIWRVVEGGGGRHGRRGSKYEKIWEGPPGSEPVAGAAAGGDMPAGKPFVAGEEGPELINAPAGATVTPIGREAMRWLLSRGVRGMVEGGTVPGNATDAILADFTNALGKYIGRGFSNPMADWMRRNQDLLAQQYLEQYMKTQTGNTVSTYDPEDFFASFNPFLQYYMQRPEQRGTYRMPAITTRRLRV